jgi:hypothetical protein
MIIQLNVPYSEKEEAKALGARWSPGRKTWFIEDQEKIEPFLKWVPQHLLKPCRKTDPRYENNSIRNPIPPADKCKIKKHTTVGKDFTVAYCGENPPW